MEMMKVTGVQMRLDRHEKDTVLILEDVMKNKFFVEKSVHWLDYKRAINYYAECQKRNGNFVKKRYTGVWKKYKIGIKR